MLKIISLTRGDSIEGEITFSKCEHVHFKMVILSLTGSMAYTYTP